MEIMGRAPYKKESKGTKVLTDTPHNTNIKPLAKFFLMLKLHVIIDEIY